MKKVTSLSMRNLCPIKRYIKEKTKTIPSLSIAMETISSNMCNYTIDYMPTSASRLLNISKEEKKMISKYIEHNKSFNKYQQIETVTQISIPSITYNNPFMSLDVIKKNKKIYNKVTKQLEEQQINLYDQSISKIKSKNFVYKTKMPKIRISQVLPSSSIEVSKNSNEKEEENKGFPSSIILDAKQKYQLYAHYCYSYKNFPEVRDHFTLTQYGTCCYLIGGIGSILNSSSTLWKLDISTLSWNKLTNTHNDLIQNRFGHTAICYQNILYIIGGRTKYLHSYIFSDFDFFDLLKNKFVDKTYVGRERWQYRYGHISKLVNNQIIVHGGISEEGKVLNDTFLISLTPFKILSCKIHIDYPGPFLTGHCDALAIPCEVLNNPRLGVYKMPDVPFGKRINLKLRQKGWYVFGGKNQNGEVQNTLYLLALGERPLKWCAVETNGIKPVPRYDATLNFYEKGNALILFGGRNDKLSDSYALNDLFFLDLFSFDWIKISLFNNDDPAFNVVHRCGHCSLLFDDKLFIFGGMNSQHFVGSALFVVNLNLDYDSQLENKKNIQKPDSKELQRHLTLKHHTSVNLNTLKSNNKPIKEEDNELYLPPLN